VVPALHCRGNPLVLAVGAQLHRAGNTREFVPHPCCALAVTPPGGSGITAAVLPEPLSQTDLYLDPATFLPVIIAFNIHPDNNALTDIPIEIHFSDYRPVSGVLIPFHVQKFLNNGLYLDLQFQSAAINSGLVASSLTN
jgi:hypothetical protein